MNLSAADVTHIAKRATTAIGLTVFVALGASTAIIYPPLIAVFLLPIAFGIVRVAPVMRAAPRPLVLALLSATAFLLPLWPIYLSIKLGPLPQLVPPRFILYVISAVWTYDMTFSRWRRGQFFYGLKKSGGVSGAVLVLFGLGVVGLPFAEGRGLAIPEFLRQATIWLVPYCAVLTYCRRQRDFVTIIRIATLAAVVVALIALAEALTHQLLANLLSPFIRDDAEWLRLAQSIKIRDGVFRAQATHTHPLSLGEHLAFSAPFALAFAIAARKAGGRLFWFGSFALIVTAAIGTSSRAAAMVMILSITAMSIVLASRFLKRASASRWRPLAGLVTATVLAISPVVGVVGAGIVSGNGGVSASNSTQSRIDQIEMAWPKIMKRPATGYGTGRSTRVLGFWGRTLTLDNYYLTLALDLGLPGPIAFASILAACAIASYRRSINSHPQLGVIYVAMFAAIISFMISRSIISQTVNLNLIYFLVPAFAGASVSFSRRRSRNRF